MHAGPSTPTAMAAPTEKIAADNASIAKGSAADSDALSIIPNSEGVTEHELATLRHVRDKMPWQAFSIAVVEFAERWTYYGTTNVFNNYIRAPLPPGSTTGAVLRENRLVGVAGALGKGQQISFAIRTFNSFFVYVTPFLGAILADTKWGRYKTICVFTVVIFLGHIILVGSATPASLAHPDAALGLLVFAILVMAIGAGSIKSNVSPMIAEQYTGKLRKETLKSGETVIISPSITIQSIYLYFYMAINLGSTAAISAAFLARDRGYWVAYLVPTCVFAAVPVVLYACRGVYVKTPPRGSIILETFRVVGMCVAAQWARNPVAFVRGLRAEAFWDVAKPSSYSGGTMPAKITWDEEFVGEVARTIAACKVFLFFPIFWLCYSQIDGNLGTVAAGMRLNGTPNDLIQNLNPIAIIIMIPIFERGLFPLLRKHGINFSPIKRIAVGFLVAGLAMVYAAVLQKYLYDTSPCHDGRPSECVDAKKNPLSSPINVWVVSGPYILVGMAEIFANITSLEYAFTKAPVRMKSVVMAFSQLQTALASALNFALVSVNVEDKFQWLFASFGIIAALFAALFYWTFRDLDRAEIRLNAIGTGERAGFAGEAPAREGAAEKA
ncbi:peptide/h+ symporter protein [Mycena belliarum]|uniref:Peptide/h+ symporter protein n=1 Tax=Mycena belliarum TaxID=1033014 RepID=A0AAD6TVM3_9AGAR|nr:peptide/h+ symporter protein [Mycena belliae]